MIIIFFLNSSLYASFYWFFENYIKLKNNLKLKYIFPLNFSIWKLPAESDWRIRESDVAQLPE